MKSNFSSYADFYNPSHGMELWEGNTDGLRKNENGVLFLIEYYILLWMADRLTSSETRSFVALVNSIQTYDLEGRQMKGLYDRGQKESITVPIDERRTISHDNLTAISCFSYMMEDFITEDNHFFNHIYDHGVYYWWRFDNVYPNAQRWSRIMHPRDMIYWSALKGNVLALVLFFFPMITNIIACRAPKEVTSGKLLAFVRLQSILLKHPLNWKQKFLKAVAEITWRICSKSVRRIHEDSWKGVFEYYFKNPNFPSNVLLREIPNLIKES